MVESIRTQNWFAVILELLIVIVGVFLGIQVSNWNESRIDSSRATAYLQRIRSDLDADLENYADRLSFWDAVSSYGTQALDFAETGDLRGSTAWQVLLAFFQSSQLAEFSTTSVTYDELKSGGELGLIRNLALGRLLAYYYTNADNPVLTERPAYREHVRGLIPLRVQNYIWTSCYRSNQYSIQSLIACEQPEFLEDAVPIIETLRADTQLVSELRYWMSTMKVATNIGKDRSRFAEQLRASIDTEVGKKPAVEER